jgi:hypothetical protein
VYSIRRAPEQNNHLSDHPIKPFDDGRVAFSCNVLRCERHTQSVLPDEG